MAIEAYLFSQFSSHDPEGWFMLIDSPTWVKLNDVLADAGWDEHQVAKPIVVANQKAEFGSVLKLLNFVQTHNIKVLNETYAWISED